MNFKAKKTPVKTGSWTIFLGLCKSCGLCLERCPFAALTFSQTDLGIYSSPAPTVDPKKCTLCQICEQVCPDTAIRVEKNA